MKKVIGILISSVCTVFVLSLLIAPQPRVQHQDSSAFQLALDLAVGRLEGARDVLATGTATPAGAQVTTPTFDGAYTCETFDQGGVITCDAGDPACPGANLPHTADPSGHTCVAGAYTCQFATCSTYDPQALTCDAFNPLCGPIPPPPHTFEPPPYNHTCEGATCDGRFTCDFTVDPRSFTCDAARPDCTENTFQHAVPTCDPTNPDCRTNNPKGFCTAVNYPTCDGVSPTCDGSPNCTTPTHKSTWGQVKYEFRGE